MPNRTQISKEGAIIAQAVARKAGLSANVLAPNLRLHSGPNDKPAPGPAEVPDLSSPAMVWDMAGGPDHTSYSLVCNSPESLRLGMHILRRDGIDVCWSIVARRNGAKIWQLDYESEAECEHDITAIRVWLDDMIAHNMSYPFHERPCIKLTLFNPATGQEL